MHGTIRIMLELELEGERVRNAEVEIGLTFDRQRL